MFESTRVNVMSNFTEMFAKMSEFEQRLENNESISESDMSEYLKILRENNNFLEQVLIGLDFTFPQ